MTSTETYYLTLILGAIGFIFIGFCIAWPIARGIGYRDGIEDVSESILDAEIIGEVEEPFAGNAGDSPAPDEAAEVGTTEATNA